MAYETLDGAFYIWFMHESDHGLSLLKPILQEKALFLNKKLGGDQTFSANKGL